MLQNTSHTLNNCGSRISGAKEARKKPLSRARGETARFSAWVRIECCSESARVSYVTATRPDLLGK